MPPPRLHPKPTRRDPHVRRTIPQWIADIKAANAARKEAREAARAAKHHHQPKVRRARHTHPSPETPNPRPHPIHQVPGATNFQKAHAGRTVTGFSGIVPFVRTEDGKVRSPINPPKIGLDKILSRRG